jgi:hydrogenase maturation factor
LNLVTGEVMSIKTEEGIRVARIRVAKAYFKVPLTLVPEASVGDVVLVESGVAIARVNCNQSEES